MLEPFVIPKSDVANFPPHSLHDRLVDGRWVALTDHVSPNADLLQRLDQLIQLALVKFRLVERDPTHRGELGVADPLDRHLAAHLLHPRDAVRTTDLRYQGERSDEDDRHYENQEARGRDKE